MNPELHPDPGTWGGPHYSFFPVEGAFLDDVLSGLALREEHPAEYFSTSGLRAVRGDLRAAEYYLTRIETGDPARATSRNRAIIGPRPS